MRFGSYCRLHFTRSISLLYFVSLQILPFLCSRSVFSFISLFFPCSPLSADMLCRLRLHCCISMMLLFHLFLYFGQCFCDPCSAFEFSAHCFALLPNTRETEPKKEKEIFWKNKKNYIEKSQCATCDTWTESKVQRHTHTATQGDRQRSFKILILIRYKSANKSFFIVFVVEKRAWRKIGATQGLLLSYQLFFFFSVYLPNDNLYYFLSINVRLWNYSI